MPKFVKEDAPAGRLVINDHYVFEDGVLTCSKSDAAKMNKILTTYYGCKLVEDDAVETVVEESSDTSLNVDVTKVGEAKVAEPKVDSKVKAKG